MPWRVYIIQCSDSKLYTGITNDIERRIKQHNSGNGCKFTRCRYPVELIYTEKAVNRVAALKREAQIKSYPRLRKLELISKKPCRRA
ncbi:MAG: GIY-YIG nuclease family protein [Candidatus Omnitrophica bacterium]|nr:GIY-YIG nuclease family protein [Candidatus Omnitrophota bacterium]MDD5654213.1 GIY-YIG nuclease family protein [Candidatus Omnitrophota bacterium]